MTRAHITREELEAALALGGSAREIGDRLGLTRNALIGRASRMGLALPNAGVVSAPRQKGVSVPKPAGSPRLRIVSRTQARRDLRDKDNEPAPFVDGATGENITLLTVGRDQCKWPHGELPNITLCGHPAEPGKPYCPHHCARAWSGSASTPEDRRRGFEARRTAGMARTGLGT